LLLFNGRAWTAILTSEAKIVRGWRGADSTIWVQEDDRIFQLAGGLKKQVERVGALTGSIKDIAALPGGVFFVATSQGLTRQAPALWRAPAAMVDDVVTSIVEDRLGRIWSAAGSRLLRFDGSSWRTFPLPDLKGELVPNQLYRNA
jgi:Predicted periplasmic ligand-binding sensor domain